MNKIIYWLFKPIADHYFVKGYEQAMHDSRMIMLKSILGSFKELETPPKPKPEGKVVNLNDYRKS